MKEKPSALYLVDQSEIRGRIPDEKRRERNAVQDPILSVWFLRSPRSVKT